MKNEKVGLDSRASRGSRVVLFMKIKKLNLRGDNFIHEKEKIGPDWRASCALGSVLFMKVKK